MFDRYQVGPSSISVHETRTINEHRAPTDESVRLLTEMEEKVLERVIFSEKTASNELQIFMLVLRPSFDTGNKATVMRFVRERVASDIATNILSKFPVEA